jgi:hypothetical protein
MVILAGAAVAVSTTALVYGLGNLKRNCTQNDTQNAGDFSSGVGGYDAATQDCQADTTSAPNQMINGTGDGHVCTDYTSVTCYIDPRKTTTNLVGLLLAIGGGVGTVGSSVWFVLELLNPGTQGAAYTPNSRERVWLAKWNGPQLVPVIAPNFAGIAGQF